MKGKQIKKFMDGVTKSAISILDSLLFSTDLIKKMVDVKIIFPTKCDQCNFMIEHEDSDKWGEKCGKCGRSKESLIEIQDAVENNLVVSFNAMEKK